MSAVLTPVSGERWELIADLVGPTPGSVLDIGCRDRALAAHLPAATRYVGVDLGPPADVIASAEEPLPFGDGEFDTAVLADVLEHLEHPHDALGEALRVATRQVVVLLPNMYSLLHRARYAAGRTAGKYAFGPERVVDRHRWLMNTTQAQAFTTGVAEQHGWQVTREHGHDGHFRRPASRAIYRAARTAAGPDLWAWEYVARLEPRP